MLKKILFSLIAISISTCVQAQNIETPSSSTKDEIIDSYDDDDDDVVPKPIALGIGAKVGVNYSFANDIDNIDMNMKGNVGFNGGIILNMRFCRRPLSKYADTGRIGLQLEALYSSESFKAEGQKIHLNRYEIPLLFQWWFISRLCIEIGPTFTGTFSVSPEKISHKNITYITEDIKGNDIMLSIGTEYKGKKGFSMGLRYNLGNSNLANNFETKVSSLSFNIGWIFTVVK